MPKNNVNKITIPKAKEYLNFIDNILTDLLVTRRIFMDFDCALIEQKAKQNLFTNFVLRLYYQYLILNLCKLLEYKSKNQYTLRHFINTIKNTECGNYQMFEEFMREATIDMHELGTNNIKKMKIGDLMLKEFKEIDFDADLDFVESIYNRIKDFRNKRVCHNDIDYVEQEHLPSIDELHNAIDKIKNMFVKYFHIFRIAMVYDDLDRPQRYSNFKLFLK